MTDPQPAQLTWRTYCATSKRHEIGSARAVFGVLARRATGPMVATDKVVGDDRVVRRVVAKVAHQIPERPPLQLIVGESVEAGEPDSEWPEFVFVTTSRGSGWVPARHLSAPFGHAIVQTPYDTTELPTQDGEVLEVLTDDLASGWLWCRSPAGREGWVPAKTLEDTS
jgi:hypothetical protein